MRLGPTKRASAPYLCEDLPVDHSPIPEARRRDEVPEFTDDVQQVKDDQDRPQIQSAPSWSQECSRKRRRGAVPAYVWLQRAGKRLKVALTASRPKPELLLSSFGGVGSKCLLKGVLGTGKWHRLRHAHTHMRTPPNAATAERRKIVYMFGDPLDAVLSFFDRRSRGRTILHGFSGKVGPPQMDWVVTHCRHLGGDYERMDANWSLEDYLENGEDLFRMEDHFDRWTTSKMSYPILTIRYETMWEHLPLIFAYLCLPQSRIRGFPPKRERRANFRDYPPQVQSKLLDMYGCLQEKIREYPDIAVR